MRTKGLCPQHQCLLADSLVLLLSVDHIGEVLLAVVHLMNNSIFGTLICIILFWQVVSPTVSWALESRQVSEVCPYISLMLAGALPRLPLRLSLGCQNLS